MNGVGRTDATPLKQPGTSTDRYWENPSSQDMDNEHVRHIELAGFRQDDSVLLTY